LPVGLCRTGGMPPLKLPRGNNRARGEGFSGEMK
jgi:hypothetical protein